MTAGRWTGAADFSYIPGGELGLKAGRRFSACVPVMVQLA
jgi:hypothetical protein